MLKKNSLAEASLEAKKHYSRDLQEQKLQLQKELDRSKAKVWRKPVSCLLSGAQAFFVANQSGELILSWGVCVTQGGSVCG